MKFGSFGNLEIELFYVNSAFLSKGTRSSKQLKGVMDRADRESII